MTHRPCGACGELVPADTGCQHWQPGRSAKAAASATARRVKREAKARPVMAAQANRAISDAIQPRRRVRSREAMDRLNEQARDRYAAKKAATPPRPRRQLASDRERVEEFARIMGRTYR